MDLWYLPTYLMQPFDLIFYILTEFVNKEKITFVMILIDIMSIATYIYVAYLKKKANKKN